MIDEPLRSGHLNNGSTQLQMIKGVVRKLFSEFEINVIDRKELSSLVLPHLAELLAT